MPVADMQQKARVLLPAVRRRIFGLNRQLDVFFVPIYIE